MDLDLSFIPNLAQFFHGGAQTRLDRAEGPAQHFSDLALTQTLIVSQFDHPALIGVQCLHGEIQTAPAGFVRLRIEVGHCLPNVFGIIRIGQGGAAGFEAQAVERNAAGDGQQPRQEGSAFGEVLTGAAPQFEEGILRGFLRQHGVAEDAQGQTMHAAGMTVIQSEEGAFISICHLRDQPGFIWIGHRFIVPNLFCLVTMGS